MEEYDIYRFTHADGTAKEWAYRELDQGQAEIRWGPANQLRQSQVKPLREAWARAAQKVAKGYVKVGIVALDEHGTRVPSRRSTQPPRQTIVDLSALFGPETDSFYF